MINPAIAQAVEFTKTYKEYKDAPIPIREAMCNKVQYPGLLPGPRDGDVYAGRCRGRRIVHVGSMAWFGKPWYSPEDEAFGKHGGYSFDFSALYTFPHTSEERVILEELDAFWRTESSMAKVSAQTDIKFDAGFLSPHDIDKLVAVGLPGLIAEVDAMPEGDFRTGLQIVLKTVTDVCEFYKKDAEEKGYTSIAKNMAAIISHAPATIAEALQIILIFDLLSHERHYELFQLDVAIGDIFVKEVDSGSITEEAAIELIRAFFVMINENGDDTVCRLLLGGKGRRNAKNADRFIVAALKAEQLHKRVTPQVTLRIYDGMDADILTLAYDTICITGTLPLLYNDDAIIPGVAEAFGVSPEDAKNYYMVGCGEYIIAPHSPGLLITNWNVPKTVDEGIRAACGAETFDELYACVMKHMTAHAVRLAEFVAMVVKTHNKSIAFLMASLLVNDCLARNKPVLDGGARYIGVSIMGHGYTNAADGLTAIKKLVFEDKTYTMAEIIQALDANFCGYDDIRMALTNMPKYGNDNADADAMLSTLWHDISVIAKKAGQDCGLDFHTMASANPGGYYLSQEMGATTDGRLEGTPYAICNAPTAGNDKSGLTALMNSILKTHPANGGTVTNFKISREFFVNERAKFEALFAAYWADGGQQANITIVNKGDLEAALKEPEKFPNLLVRMGGWSARFIDLEPYIQKEILTRTLY